MKRKYSFTQDGGGKHFIKVKYAKAHTEMITLDFAEMSASDTREVINGLGNMLSSVACYMYKLEEAERIAEKLKEVLPNGD